MQIDGAHYYVPLNHRVLVWYTLNTVVCGMSEYTSIRKDQRFYFEINVMFQKYPESAQDNDDGTVGGMGGIQGRHRLRSVCRANNGAMCGKAFSKVLSARVICAPVELTMLPRSFLYKMVETSTNYL